MRLVPEKSPLPRLLVFPFGLVAVFGFLLARFQNDFVLKAAFCPLRDFTGIPCPTCGGTHAAVALVQGHLETAILANPLVTVGLVLFGLWLLVGLLATIFPGLRRDLEMSPREKRAARILAALMVLATWIWEIRALV